MKGLFFTCLWIVCAVTVMAQTDFRHLSYNEAIAAAKAEKKMVFIDFYTSWCGPCKMMMKNVFPQKSVGDYLNARFVCIKIDAEKGEGVELAKRYRVTAYPTFIGIDTGEKEVMRKVGAASSDDFIAEIERQINPDKSPERLKERYESGERTADLIAAYAALKISESRAGRKPDETKKQEAFRMVDDYFNGLKHADRLAAENLFVYTSYIESTTDPKARFMITHREKFAPEIRDDIRNLIAKLYEIQVINYLTCRVPYNGQEYRQMKQDFQELGLNTDGVYSPVFELIESHAAGDGNAYMDVLEKEYPRLSDNQKKVFLTSLSSVFGTQDEAVKKRASRFIRSLLADMDANTLMWTAMELGKLEGTMGH